LKFQKKQKITLIRALYTFYIFKKRGALFEKIESPNTGFLEDWEVERGGG
jgi:hypothetical protein